MLYQCLSEGIIYRVAALEMIEDGRAVCGSHRFLLNRPVRKYQPKMHGMFFSERTAIATVFTELVEQKNEGILKQKKTVRFNLGEDKEQTEEQPAGAKASTES